jgi:V8-like Glu-specific endopeptidase
MRSADPQTPSGRPFLRFLFQRFLFRRRSALLLWVAGALAIVAGIALSPAAARDVGAHLRAPGMSAEPTIGALFSLQPGGKLGSHFCTASVVDSPAGDLLLTAAHCVTGRAASQMAFVPDYGDGKIPYGVWTVSRVIVDSQWQASADADDDFAFLVVSQQGTTSGIEDLTGGEVIGIRQPAGLRVEVAGYPDAGEAAITCANTATSFGQTQFEFDCDGFTDGTSGSPLLAAPARPGGMATVIGVIGGYQQGGDTASVSYAARFSSRTEALYETAVVESGLHSP